MSPVLLLAAMQALSPSPPATPDSAAALSVVVDLSAFSLEVRDLDRVVARFPVAIGVPAYPTPTGSFLVTQVELNPSWTPPASPWAAGRRPTPPGPANPMGRAKLLLKPQYYLHGTPDSLSVGSAASHGCIRLRNRDVLALARMVIAAGSPALADSAAAIVADSVGSRRIVFQRAIRVDVQ